MEEEEEEEKLPKELEAQKDVTVEENVAENRMTNKYAKTELEKCPQAAFLDLSMESVGGVFIYNQDNIQQMNTDAGMLGLFGEVQKPQEQPKPKKKKKKRRIRSIFTKKSDRLSSCSKCDVGGNLRSELGQKVSFISHERRVVSWSTFKVELKYLLIKLTDFKDYNWCGHVVQHFRSEMKTLLTSTSLTTANIDFNLLMICVCQKFNGKPKQKLE